MGYTRKRDGTVVTSVGKTGRATDGDYYTDSSGQRWSLIDVSGRNEVRGEPSLQINPAGANNALLYQAVEPDEGGEGITVEHIDPAGNNVPLSVAVVGKAIAVTLATDGVSAPTSTANDVKAAVEAHAVAGALVDVSLGVGDATNTGAGICAAAAAAPLVRPA